MRFGQDSLCDLAKIRYAIWPRLQGDAYGVRNLRRRTVYGTQPGGELPGYEAGTPLG